MKKSTKTIAGLPAQSTSAQGWSPTLPLSATPSRSYVPGIDGLRAIAVLSVMIYHLKAGVLLGGFVGVDVFFVISGFVVTLAIRDRRFQTVFELFSYFYARRLIRIAPALVAMLLITSVATVAFVPSAWLSEANRTTAFFAFFGLSNIRLAQMAEDYFAPRIDFNPFAHTWSLGVEEQFYFIFPFVIGLGVVSWSKRGSALPFVIVALLSLVSFVACLLLTNRDPVFSFFQLPTRFWELGAGVAFALSEPAWNRRLKGCTVLTLNIIGLAAIIVLTASLVFSDENHFPFPWAILPVGASAALICVFFSRSPTLITRTLSARPLIFVGLISYSLYLWHWPIYVLLRWTTGLDSVLTQTLAVSLTFIAAMTSYYLIEQPFRNSSFLARLRRPAAAAALLLIILAGAKISAMTFRSNSLALSVTKNSEIWDPWDLGTFPNGCRPSTDRSELAIGTVLSISPPPCSRPEGSHIFVFGDSHAGVYIRMLAMLSSQEGVFISIYSFPGCPLMDFRVPDRLLPIQCAEFNRAAEIAIQGSARQGDYLFLPSLRLDRYRDQWGGRIKQNVDSEANDMEAVQDAITFIQTLTKRGVKVIIEAPLPLFKSPPYRCSDWFNRMNPVCDGGFTISRTEIERRRSKIMDVEAKLAATSPGISMWDPLPVLCDQAKCDAFDRGYPIFLDGDHLSGYGSRTLYESFRSHLASISGNLR